MKKKFNPKQTSKTFSQNKTQSDNFLSYSDTKQKQTILRQFFQCLLTDPTLKDNKHNYSSSIAELLYFSKYPIKQVMNYDYNNQKFIPEEIRPVVDMALLMNLLFKEKGWNCTVEDLMRHVLEGGQFQTFLKKMEGKKTFEPKSV